MGSIEVQLLKKIEKLCNIETKLKLIQFLFGKLAIVGPVNFSYGLRI